MEFQLAVRHSNFISNLVIARHILLVIVNFRYRMLLLLTARKCELLLASQKIKES